MRGLRANGSCRAVLGGGVLEHGGTLPGAERSVSPRDRGPAGG